VGDVDGLAEKHEVSPCTKLLQYDFVLVTEDEVDKLKHRLALEALKKQRATGIIVLNGMLVPDVD
jgi:hypothetical protein